MDSVDGTEVLQLGSKCAFTHRAFSPAHEYIFFLMCPQEKSQDTYLFGETNPILENFQTLKNKIEWSPTSSFPNFNKHQPVTDSASFVTAHACPIQLSTPNWVIKQILNVLFPCKYFGIYLKKTL